MKKSLPVQGFSFKKILLLINIPFYLAIKNYINIPFYLAIKNYYICLKRNFTRTLLFQLVWTINICVWDASLLNARQL